MALGLQYCLELSHQDWTRGDPRERAQRTIEVVQAADRARFDSVWLTEDPDGWDAFAVLGALSRETGWIRLGTGVTNPFLRHPNLIAASVSTIDILSGGRAFLGLGRGQPEWYRTALGMEVGSPLAAVEEAVDLLRQWWRPPHVAHGEPPFPVNGWERSLNPLSMPPIYLAATGDKMLDLAGRIADGVRFNELASPDFLRNAIGRVKRSATSAGRNPDHLSFFVHPSLVITDEPERELERKKGMMATVHALPGMERQLQTPGIDVEAIMAEVRRHMRTEEVLAHGGGFPELRRAGDLDAAKRAIPTELVDRVAVVGSPRHARARLRELLELGATHVFLDIDWLPRTSDALPSLLAEIDLSRE
jgi:5,10-methylenetetrahydromethanopterin reductase